MAKKRKKKKKSLPPRTKRMNRQRKLQSAKLWLESYKGKQPVHAYRRRYGVDLLCAIAELKKLGLKIDPQYEEAVKRSVEERISI